MKKIGNFWLDKKMRKIQSDIFLQILKYHLDFKIHSNKNKNFDFKHNIIIYIFYSFSTYPFKFFFFLTYISSMVLLSRPNRIEIITLLKIIKNTHSIEYKITICQKINIIFKFVIYSDILKIIIINSRFIISALFLDKIKEADISENYKKIN